MRCVTCLAGGKVVPCCFAVYRTELGSSVGGFATALGLGIDRDSMVGSIQRTGRIVVVRRTCPEKTLVVS